MSSGMFHAPPWTTRTGCLVKAGPLLRWGKRLVSVANLLFPDPTGALRDRAVHFSSPAQAMCAERSCRRSRKIQNAASFLLPLRLQFLHIQSSDVMSDIGGLGSRQIRQHHNGQLIVHVARDVGGEPLPGALVLNHPVSMHLMNEPAKAIAVFIRLAVA